MHGALAAGARLQSHHAVGLGRVAARVAGLPSPLRWRLARNMRRAGIEPTPRQLDAYFRLMGHWFGQSVALYHRGFAGAGLEAQITFDESAAHLQSALDQGRGAILAEFHYHYHEIGAAAIAQRYPLAVIVSRE